MPKIFVGLGAAVAGLAGWRAWKNRQSQDEVTFDWDVPAAPGPASQEPVTPVEPAGGAGSSWAGTAASGSAEAPVVESHSAAASEADPDQRERESMREPETKFEQETDREADVRREAAERLRDEPLPEPDTT